MAEVIFIVDEEEKKIELFPGQTLLSGAYKLELDEIGYGECGGNCSCSTCHVYVQEGGEGFAPPSTDEEDLLDTVPTVAANSRLGCQLRVADQKRIVVKVPKP